MDLRSQKRRSGLGPSVIGSQTSIDRSYTQHSVRSAQSLNRAATKRSEHQQRQKPTRVKLVCVGDGGSGKTSLLLRYMKGDFPEIYVPTVFENYVKHVKRNDKVVELALWDTAGQEEYDRLRALSYPETDVLLVCYSVDVPISLENAFDKWVPEIQHYCPGIPFILVGLKSDSRASAEHPISYDAGLEIGLQYGASAFIECSAKLGQNIDEVFQTAIRAALKPHDRPILREAQKRGVGRDKPKPTLDPPVPPPHSHSKASSNATAIHKSQQRPAASKPTQSLEHKNKKKKKRCLIL